jgi:phage gp46-like protein
VVDLKIIENFNGGDVVYIGGDFRLTHSFDTMVYLALFGGNVEVLSGNQNNTNGNTFNGTEYQNVDWWGNTLLMQETPSTKYVSLTEKTLSSVAMTSSSIEKIKRAVIEDLNFMSQFANISVSVSIIGVDRYIIFIRIERPMNLESQEFTYIWNAFTQTVEIN